jgi:hypothetical protein
MTLSYKSALAFSALFLAPFVASPASAQATRTWVSGVGDDVNPCSRTAPCKTFAGAISKTAAGGEINCLDPGGFGTVTITKSITIDCRGTFGSILASNTNGINVNDSASGFPGTIRVILRGLTINGAGGGAQNASGNPGTGLIGINFTSGALLVVEDVLIQRFNSGSAAGISFRPSAAAQLMVSDSVIADNGAAAAGGGIVVNPSGAAGNARVQILNTRILRNVHEGIRADATGNTNGNPITVNIESSQIAGSNSVGVVLAGSAGLSFLRATVINSVVNNNAIGLHAFGPGSRIEVGESTLTDNTTPLQFTGGGVIFSYGNNRTSGNGSAAVFTAPNLQEN